MGMFQWLVFVAIAATLFSLASGIFSMVNDGEVRHNDSAQWMNWRVGCQALAAALVLLAIYGAQ
jgi:hypoxia induced protein